MNWFKWGLLWLGLSIIAIASILSFLPQFDAFAVGELAGLFGFWPYIIGSGFYLKYKNRSLWWLLFIFILWLFSFLDILAPKL